MAESVAKKPDLDLTAAGRASGKVALQDVRLAMTHFLVAPSVDEKYVSDLHTEYYAEVVEHNEESLVLAVGFRLSHHPGEGEAGDAEGDAGEHEHPEVEAYADYLLMYELSEPVSEDDVQHFAWINGVFNAWPYWRARVQGTFADMGLPKLIVAPFRVPLAAQQRQEPAEDRAARAGAAKNTARTATAKKDAKATGASEQEG